MKNSCNNAQFGFVIIYNPPRFAKHLTVVKNVIISPSGRESVDSDDFYVNHSLTEE